MNVNDFKVIVAGVDGAAGGAGVVVVVSLEGASGFGSSMSASSLLQPDIIRTLTMSANTALL